MALAPFFSQRLGYGTHALSYMAKKPPGSFTTLSELADWLRGVWPSMSEAYLSQTIQRLTRGGILQSHRGIAGGYSLRRPAEEITIREVVEVLEGVSQHCCILTQLPECPVRRHCPVECVMGGLKEKYLQLLEECSVADLASGRSIDLQRETRQVTSPCRKGSQNRSSQ